MVGPDAHGFAKHQLATYRDVVAEPTTGAEVGSIVGELDFTGHEVGGETYKHPPRGFVADGTAERLLRHSARYVHEDLPLKAATSTEFIDTVLRRWRAFGGLHGWLCGNVHR